MISSFNLKANRGCDVMLLIQSPLVLRKRYSKEGARCAPRSINDLRLCRGGRCLRYAPCECSWLAMRTTSDRHPRFLSNSLSSRLATNLDQPGNAPSGWSNRYTDVPLRESVVIWRADMSDHVIKLTA